MSSRAPGLGSPLAWIAPWLAGLVVAMGTLWAFTRHAPDFSVFYSAWKLVLEGRGSLIYQTTVTPDRFLYAPGFAWLLSPLGLLPKELALAFWCLAKAIVVGHLVRELSPKGAPRAAAFGVGALGVVLVARPLLIDFQYGQVNTLILGACIWALLGHFRGQRGEGAGSAPLRDVAGWFVLGVVAVAKVFPLPLVLVPWVSHQGLPAARLRRERAGVVFGMLVAAFAPLPALGLRGALALLAAWRDALIARGLPLESHNQSFSAFLHHYFSGEPTHVVSHGMIPVMLGVPWLSGGAIGALSIGWMALTAALLLGWLLTSSRRPPLTWISVLVALLILPSHLVWKPYFVMALPLSILAVRQATSVGRVAALAVIFAAMNLTGFDFVGPAWGARFEAASVMLWSELALIAFVLTASERDSGAPG